MEIKNGGIFSKMAQFKNTYSFYNPYCSWFHIWKCTYSLKRIHNLKSVLGKVVTICGQAQGGESICCLMQSFLAEARWGDVLPSCFSYHTVNKCPFHGMFSPTFFIFCTFLLVISCLKWPSSRILKCRLVFLSAGRLWCSLWRKYLC